MVKVGPLYINQTQYSSQHSSILLVEEGILSGYNDHHKDNHKDMGRRGRKVRKRESERMSECN